MSRSSSSPDVLAPPGDTDYIISSPAKPFSGRQSFMSPADFRFLHRARKRQRVTLSPDKRPHSISFDDILLPVSPTMKLNDRSISPSPDKLMPGKIVSPWRVRFTLEATQNGNSRGSPGKRRESPSKTTKIPLKDDTGRIMYTPRRRDRPKRYTVQESAKTSLGSPGHTPGPKGAGQKRKRDLPGRSIPEFAVHSDTQLSSQMLGPGPVKEISNELPDSYEGDPFLDEAIRRRDGISDRKTSKESPTRMPFNTPDVDSVDQEYMDDQSLLSTPSKMPSPRREPNVCSPQNVLHAGSTPGPRTYPTPTPSQVDENPEWAVPYTSTNELYAESHDTGYPADNYRELDSIVESEEFSMVSLDALSSTRQRGLNGSQRLTKGHLQPLLQRESIGVTDNMSHEAPTANSRSEYLSTHKQLPPDHRLSGLQPSHDAQGQPTSNNAILIKSRPSMTVGASTKRLRLTKVVRLGIALAGTLKGQSGGSAAHGASYFDIEGSKKRLEAVFGSYRLETRRILQVGLGLGQKLAMLRQTETEKVTPITGIEITESVGRGEGEKTNAQQFKQVGMVRDEGASSEMKQRMAEWQHEREAVSGEIEMANSSRTIVVNSDDSEDPEDSQKDRTLSRGDVKFEQGSAQKSVTEDEQEPELSRSQLEQELSDDGVSLDIWQEEARDHSQASYQPSILRSPGNELRQSSSHVSRMKGSSVSSLSEANPTTVQAAEKDTMPYLGQSRVRQLRELDLDLSPLFQEEYTPGHYRYYYGESNLANNGQRQRLSLGSSREEDNEIRRSDSAATSDNGASRTPGGREYDGSSLSLTQKRDDEGKYPVSPATGRFARKQPNIVLNSAQQTTPSTRSSAQLRRIDSSTPGWLRVPRARLEKIPEDDERPASFGSIADPTKEQRDYSNPNPQQRPGPERQAKEARRPKWISPRQQPRGRVKALSTREITQRLLGHKTAEGPLPFSDTHYAALRRLFHRARRDRNAFPYYPRPGRSDVIGAWYMTPDGAYRVQITKEQFAIIDQLKLELEDPNTDLIDEGWDEVELHQRLISVIIGERIRDERKHEERDTNEQHGGLDIESN